MNGQCPTGGSIFLQVLEMRWLASLGQARSLWSLWLVSHATKQIRQTEQIK